jgi:hypothetical protein
MRVRLTQRELYFGIYWGKPQSLNPGLSVWWKGKYVWPRKRGHAKLKPKAPILPFEVQNLK